MAKSLCLGFLFFLVPLEKLNIYYAGVFSITIKSYFIVLPVIFYYFFKRIVSLFVRRCDCHKVLFSFTCWGLLIALVIVFSILHLNSGVSIGPSFYRLYTIILLVAIIWIIDDYNEIVAIKRGYILAGIASAAFAYFQGGMFFLGSEVDFLDFTIGSGDRRLGYSSAMTLPREGDIVRLTGLNYDPNLLAITLIIAIVSAVSFVLGQVKRRVVYMLAIFLMLPVVLATFSRSAYLILGILLVFLFLKYWKALFSAKVAIFAFALFMIIAVIGITFAEDILHRFGASGSKSDHYHMLFGYGAFMLGLDHWFLGHGIGTFEKVFLDSEYNIYSGLSRANPHSLPLAIFFELGLVGLVFYGGLVVSIVWISVRAKIYMSTPLHHDLWLFRILFITLILHNTVNDYFHVELFILFFAFYVALLRMALKR